MAHSTQRQVFSARTLKASAHFALFLILWAVFGMCAVAQTAARPDRGIGPTDAYAVSNIESVSLTNGNMGLAIPLAALPPIAGGKLSWALKAHYNSKLWNTHLKDVQDSNGNYVQTTLQQSNEGGWKIGWLYSMQFRHRDEEYEVILPDDHNSQAYYDLYNYSHKMVLTTPDGATHELRAVDYTSSVMFDFNRGYYKDSPWSGSLNTAVRYYSFDGSHLWAKVDPFTTSPTSWTVYMPDGSVIENSNGIQRIKDTNGNKIKLWTEIVGSLMTSHFQDELTGREIKYVENFSTNTGQVQYQTVGGTWVSIDINWGETHVFGKSYEDGSPCGLEQLLNEWPRVVRSIVLPQTEAGQARQQFTFSYNSDTTDSVNFQWRIQCDPATYLTNTSASHGWGALSQMMTPAGATVNYGYGLDGTSWNQLGGSTIYAAREGLASKSVTHDSTTDTWAYGNSHSVSNPDGSFTDMIAYPYDPALQRTYGGSDGRAGLVYKTNQSNKVIIERHWTRMVFSGYNDFVPGGIAVFNPVVDKEYTTLMENGVAVKMSAKTFQFDYNGNVL